MPTPTDEELQLCLDILGRAQGMKPDDPGFLRLEEAAAYLRKSAKKKRSKLRRQRTQRDDQAKLQGRELWVDRFGPPQTSPQPRELSEGHPETLTTLTRERRCYVCREPFRELHPYYDQLCRPCGDLCLGGREARADLSGRRALVTGGRIKIGYAIALRLLRDGAEVHVTSRFPKDALSRYEREDDYAAWADRLSLHRADFRNIPSLLRLIEQWNDGPAFDILINNAAQTVWRPPEYYRQLWAREDPAIAALPGPTPSDDMLALNAHLFPAGKRDSFGDPIDLRRENSWVQTLGEIAPIELVESQAVNAMAPYLLCSELKPSFLRASSEDRYIVNVAAAEGQFARESKSHRHPHTNMAKAALNMLTCTSAADYAEEGIYMVSVDPGWVSHEVPEEMKSRAVRKGFHTPLAMEDAASRLYHPILSGIAGRPIYGTLLKDYQPAPW